MLKEVKIPSVGESVQEGEISRWSKEHGAIVQRDEVLLELETDKATVEVVSEYSGRLEIIKAQGSVVKVGEIVAKIDTSVALAAPQAKADPSQSANPPPPPPPMAAPKSGASPRPEPGPAAAKLIQEHGLNAQALSGSGKRGQVTKADVIGQISQPQAAQAPVHSDSAPAAKSKPPLVQGGERREKLSRIRATIADRLLHAQNSTAMLTTFNEIDMSAVMNLRKKYKDAFLEQHGIGLGFMSFFVKAVCESLKKYPELNGWIEGQEIVYHDYYHVGVAVSTEKGLMVPVIRNADQLDFAGVESAIVAYSKKARDGKISLDDLNGGTFTVSNGGIFGSLLSTPILNPPQSGILGMHKIQERPVVIEGQIQIRPMMYLALSYDHRIVDGKGAVGFLVSVKQLIEDPSRLLLGV